MARVIKSPQYKRDAHEIWSYIARENLHAADALFRRVEEKTLMLADFPGVGRSRDELSAGLRSFVVWPFILLYRQVSGGIELVRILHGSRDIPAEFQA